MSNGASDCLEAGEPLLLHEHRARTVPAAIARRITFADSAMYRPPLGLGDAAQRDVGEPGVVGDGVGCGVAGRVRCAWVSAPQACQSPETFRKTDAI